MTNVDVHQHLWSPSLVTALRSRREPPYLDGWTLHLDGEPPYELPPADHDVALRAELAAADGLGLALVSLSAPIGVEWLPAAEARPLLDAYHEGAAALPRPFGAWAAAGVRDIDAKATAQALDQGFVGLQLPANALADAAGYARCAPLLDLLEERGLPLFVHPGPAAGGSEGPAGGPRWSPTSSRCTPPGSRSVRTAGPVIHVCGCASRCSPDSPRCTGSGSPPAGAA